MDAIINGLPVYMMVGIVVVIGISQFHRIAGAVIGVIFWISVIVVGTEVYNRGGHIGFPGNIQLPREIFYAMCVIIGGAHGFTGWVAYKRKGRPPPSKRAIEDGDDD